ncbi:MAG: hypothetical protein H0S85_07380 [Desulfovibrionaceae bacterium]|jgi:hypothetical protein|nr:hypothetical protein [Desulfovibrionaceae bacterium]
MNERKMLITVLVGLRTGQAVWTHLAAPSGTQETTIRFVAVGLYFLLGLFAMRNTLACAVIGVLFLVAGVQVASIAMAAGDISTLAKALYMALGAVYMFGGARLVALRKR